MKLIAYDITNLTDARYFAARGAHMIGFSVEHSTIEEVNAIKDWVDVPAFFLHLPENPTAELIWEWQDRTGVSSFLVSDISDEVVVLFPKAQWISFLTPTQKESYLDLSYIFINSSIGADSVSLANLSLNLNQDIPAYLEFSPYKSINLKEEKWISGVLIQGSEEDKVGLKSYDEIDEFLDTIDLEY
jgi:hypothetical protein